MLIMKFKIALCALVIITLVGCGNDATKVENYDVIIRGGTIYDGSGEAGVVGDVAINGDQIIAVGDIGSAVAIQEVDATGLAVAPGFINMMSWGPSTLIMDGRGVSDIKQGVTLEVFGEGFSFGPLNPAMKENFLTDWGVEAKWTTLGEYLEYLEEKGVSPNISSFVGAATLRIHEVGFNNRKATPEEMERMREQMRAAMKEGALGVASSLIYPPGSFADTEELIELSKVAAEYGGMYASHMRDEADSIFEAVDELITITREAKIASEIYHIKLASPRVWGRYDELVAKIEAAQAEGLKITADIYTYPAGSTGLDSVFPAWVKEGVREDMVKRFLDPETRQRIIREMNQLSTEWENMFLNAKPEGILLVGFENKELDKYIGKTLAFVSAERGTSPENTAMDLIVENGNRVQTVYFTQSEDVVRKFTAVPWVSFNSDAAALAAEGAFLEDSTHPRAYGSFARLLAKYVREEKTVPLGEAIRKLAALPADNMSLKGRGYLKAGYFADIAIFNPDTIQDHATFEKPHQYATGMKYVFVNGTLVLDEGEPTGATAGRFIRGPGWKKP